MYSFKNDYSEGAHPNILKALVDTNMIQEEGYGLDSKSQNAISLIKTLAGDQDADVHFVTGGTQANLIAISAFLRPHQSCLSASTGHIFANETGAIEATGHKVIPIDTEDGKLSPSLISPVLEAHSNEHHVKPKLVYISNPTELGTIYKKEELESLYAFCRENKMILYIDGARLGSALCSDENDMDMSDICRCSDAFFIGGTKNGALLGEAIVISKEDLKEDFRYHLKQKGALLAKGRILGIQFEELFKDGLYFDLAKQANEMAGLLRKGIGDAGYKFLIDSPSNQVFPILPDKLIQALEKDFAFYPWLKVDGENTAIRLVTSWATKKECVLEFIDALNIKI